MQINYKNIASSGIFKNYIFLSAYQVVNFLVPLIIFPIVIKKTGLENFGKIAFSYAFVNYFNVLTDYGFNLSATRNIAVSRLNIEAVRKIYTSVVVAKLLLFFISAIVFAGLLGIPFFREEYKLHLLSFTVVAAQVLMPLWLFQGMEDMKYLAIFNAFAKICFAILIIVFVQLPQHYLLVNFLLGIGGIIAAFACHLVARRTYKIHFVRITVRDISNELRDGFVLFLSSLAVNIYVISNVFILGIFASPLVVGYYSIAEKVYFAIKQLTSVFSQVIFPRICQLAKQSIDQLLVFQKKIFFPFLVCLLLICLVVWYYAGFIGNYFLPGDSGDVQLLIRIFCIVPIIVAFDIPAFQALLALNEKAKYSVVLISGCVLNVIANVFLAQRLGALGTTISVLLTELYITVGLMTMFGKVIKAKKQLQML
ncbi:MAG: oligosaccharide flippase family protein [Ferruginibacter sp.]